MKKPREDKPLRAMNIPSAGGGLTVEICQASRGPGAVTPGGMASRAGPGHGQPEGGCQRSSRDAGPASSCPFQCPCQTVSPPRAGAGPTAPPEAAAKRSALDPMAACLTETSDGVECYRYMVDSL